MPPVCKFTPIGVVHSCFREKFGIPRQAGLAPAAMAEIELQPPFNAPEALRGLSAFSHIWVVFVFHGVLERPWRPTVRPPRLGGNRRTGLWASRSPFRPNPIGISAVKLEETVQDGPAGRLVISGADFLDETPVLDIKPYIRYADALPDAQCGYADHPPVSDRKPVFFSSEAETVLQQAKADIDLKPLIIQILQNDPRPAYRQKEEKRVFGMRLYDYNIVWQCEDGVFKVIQIDI